MGLRRRGLGGGDVVDRIIEHGTFYGGNGDDWVTVVTGGAQTDVEDILSGRACPAA